MMYGSNANQCVILAVQTLYHQYQRRAVSLLFVLGLCHVHAVTFEFVYMEACSAMLIFQL